MKAAIAAQREYYEDARAYYKAKYDKKDTNASKWKNYLLEAEVELRMLNTLEKRLDLAYIKYIESVRHALIVESPVYRDIFIAMFIERKNRAQVTEEYGYDDKTIRETLKTIRSDWEAEKIKIA